MIASSNINKLFNESGCLSQEALLRMASLSLPEDELKLANEHISSCPLCKDAVEGIRQFEDSSVVYNHTSRINQRLRQEFGYSPHRKKAAARSPRLSIFLIPAAASIIILVGIISYFHFFFPDKNEIALLDEKEVSASEEENNAMIGGVFKEESDKKEAPVTSRVDKGDSPADVKDVPGKQEEKGTVTDALANVEEKLALTDADKDIEQPEPAIENEAITAYVVEEVAGANLEADDGKAVSRAKSGRKAATETNEMIVVYDQGASFPGGNDSLYSFLNSFMKYTVVDEQAADTLVLVQFTVSKRGNFDGFTFIRGAGDEVNAEVLRVLKVMPDWIPAIKDGKNVSEVVTLPVYLKIK